MQKEGEGCFGVALVLPVQRTQFVHIADVQLLLVNFVVEVLQETGSVDNRKYRCNNRK